MNTKTLAALGAALAVAAVYAGADPLGTAFTYQGKLTDGASSANGVYDFRCSIFDVASGGSPVAGPRTNSAVAVANGLFTVELDFLTGVFIGNARWLEIGVRTNGAAADFVLLSPRQPLTPAPYALYAPSAGTAATAQGTAPGVVSNLSLATGAVTTDKIADGTLVAADLSPALASNTFWRLGGNAGTMPGTHYLGTADSQPLEFKVNSQRALRLEPNTNGAPNVIGGSPNNFAGPGAVGATIGGGSDHTIGADADYVTLAGGMANSLGTNSDYSVIGGGILNRIAADSLAATIAGGNMNHIAEHSWNSTIGGGGGNNIAPFSDSATIAGGYLNGVSTGANRAAIGGGYFNYIAEDSASATIAGGHRNSISTNADYAAIGGGTLNTVLAGGECDTISGGRTNIIEGGGWHNSIGGGFANLIGSGANSSTIVGGEKDSVLGGAWFATVLGGESNTVMGHYSMAGGRRAKANHAGSFVWADAQDADFASAGGNQFSIRAQGGVRFVTGGAGVTLDGESVLSGLVDPGQLAAGAVVSSNLAAGAVTSTAIADGTITPADVNGGSFSNTFWKTDGNAGTVPGRHFLGTTDNQPVELWANGQRALRLEANTYGAPNLIGGAAVNFVAPGIPGATIGGGGAVLWGGESFTNSIGGGFCTIGGGLANSIDYAYYSTVGGGYKNSIEKAAGESTIGGGRENIIWSNSFWSTIAGGAHNTILPHSIAATIGGGAHNLIHTNADRATIGGGEDNTIQTNASSSTISGGGYNSIGTNSFYATIGGGSQVIISDNSPWSTIAGGAENLILNHSTHATIGGGTFNTNGGSFATVPGGYGNFADGNYSFAAGNRAKALHLGAFVWADWTQADFASTTTNQFAVRASGGVRFVTGGAGATLDGESVLSGLVDPGQLAVGAVASSNLAPGAVTSIAIADGTITPADMDVGSFSNTFWKTDGNAGTVPGTHFLGTTDNRPLELRANAERAFRLEPGINWAPNVVGGSTSNTVDGGVIGATIGGGGTYGSTFSQFPTPGPIMPFPPTFHPNRVSGNFGTVGGGAHNLVGPATVASTVGGGYDNAVADSSSAATVSGGANNWILTNATGAVIGGGRDNILFNGSSYSQVGGGRQNWVLPGAQYALIGGGATNTIHDNAHWSAIAGGWLNSIKPSVTGGVIAGGFGNAIETNASASTIAGGSGNEIGRDSLGSAIGGGASNFIRTNASFGTIPGGYDNEVAGNYGFAAGRRAKANHPGAFVWADSQAADFTSSGSNQFCIRASGGVGIGGAPEDAMLDVEGDVHLNDHDLFLRGGSDRNHGLGWSGSGKPFAGEEVDGPVAYGYKGGALGTLDPDTIALFWNWHGQVGIGTSNPGATLDVAGSVRVGAGGTTISRVQAGTIVVGPGTEGVNVRTNTFPVAFSSVPKVVVSARGGDYNDTFAVSTRGVTATSFKVNVLRLDQSGGTWAQSLQVDWIAWE